MMLAGLRRWRSMWEAVKRTARSGCRCERENAECRDRAPPSSYHARSIDHRAIGVGDRPPPRAGRNLHDQQRRLDRRRAGRSAPSTAELVAAPGRCYRPFSRGGFSTTDGMRVAMPCSARRANDFDKGLEQCPRSAIAKARVMLTAPRWTDDSRRTKSYEYSLNASMTANMIAGGLVIVQLPGAAQHHLRPGGSSNWGYPPARG